MEVSPSIPSDCYLFLLKKLRHQLNFGIVTRREESDTGQLYLKLTYVC
jgi:hypothetical protein